MIRLLLLSALCGFAFAGTGLAQTAEIQKEVDDKLKSLRKDDDALRQILATHPSVAAAQAKLALAQAELDQVKLELTQKVMGLRSELEIAQQQIEVHVKNLDRVEKLVKAGTASTTELAAVEAKVNEARLLLTRVKSQTETYSVPLRLDEKSDPKVGFNRLNSALEKAQSQRELNLYRSATLMAQAALSTSTTSQMQPGLAQVVNKPINHVANGIAPNVIEELKKKVGFTGMIRALPIRKGLPYTEKVLNFQHSGELTFAGWIELIIDDINQQLFADSLLDCYVRDYGLLISERSKAPKDAMTLRDFARGVRSETTGKP